VSFTNGLDGSEVGLGGVNLVDMFTVGDVIVVVGSGGGVESTVLSSSSLLMISDVNDGAGDPV
jgi:hypothetical protein